MNIAAIGEILIDMTQTGRDENGTAVFSACPGGAPANVAVAAARLGASASFIGCVGKDPFGAMLRRTLEENGVRSGGLQETDKASTTLAVVTVDADGERSFSFCRAPGADTLIDEAAAIKASEGCGILHFGSVSLTDPACAKTVINVVKKTRAGGALISFDPNYREALWPDIRTAEDAVRGVVPLCDIVKISAEEAEIAAGCKVKVADTNGAGDSFTGAVLCKITEKGGLSRLSVNDIPDIVRFANRAASITVGRSGAIPALPYLSSMEE